MICASARSPLYGDRVILRQFPAAAEAASFRRTGAVRGRSGRRWKAGDESKRHVKFACEPPSCRGLPHARAARPPSRPVSRPAPGPPPMTPSPATAPRSPWRRLGPGPPRDRRSPLVLPRPLHRSFLYSTSPAPLFDFALAPRHGFRPARGPGRYILFPARPRHCQAADLGRAAAAKALHMIGRWPSGNQSAGKATSQRGTARGRSTNHFPPPGAAYGGRRKAISGPAPRPSRQPRVCPCAPRSSTRLPSHS